MTIAWGNDLLDTSKGLDGLGVRRIDQAVESELVNGTTTISQRARYLSILPWALGEYLVNHASEGFEAHRLTAYLRRIEFVILAASRLDSRHNRANANGALGAYLYKDQLARLMNGESVMFPEDGRQQILGIYFARCQAIGLLLDRDQTVPSELACQDRRYGYRRIQADLRLIGTRLGKYSVCPPKSGHSYVIKLQCGDPPRRVHRGCRCQSSLHR